MPRILVAAGMAALVLLVWWLWPSAPLQRDAAHAPGQTAAAVPRSPRTAPGARPVAVATAAWENLDPGDALRFPVPGHDAPLPATVAQRMQHANGDVSLVADWDTQRGTLVLTIGALESFATLNVDGRTWNLVADADGAWAAPASALGGATEDDARVLPRETAPVNPPIR